MSLQATSLRIGDTVVVDGVERTVHAVHHAGPDLAVHFVDGQAKHMRPTAFVDIVDFAAAHDPEFDDL